jgi:hypothetical protein
MAKNDTLKKAMIEAMRASLGIVSTAAKQAGINRNTHYTWLKDDPEYAEAIDDISEAAIDFAESALHKKIQNGDTTSIIFYLKTKGKQRGYIERQEIQHSGIVLNFDKDDAKV